MSLETDLLLDRRWLKRRLTLWRVAAFIGLAAVLLLAAKPVLPDLGRHVARLNISGIVTDDRKLVDAVDRAAKDPHVAAMIVTIDSPGGSVGGGESLHDAIAHVAAVKPVVAVMRGTAASAGYMVALPAARIFARQATLTGSIGVLLETPEISGLMEKIGVTATTYVSGPLKDQPSLTHPTSAAGQVVLQGLVTDLYGMFVDMVAQGRHMDVARVRELADGRAYTGRQAKPLGLIDDFGGEPEARHWIAAQHADIPDSMPIRDIATGDWRQRLIGAKSLSGLVEVAIGATLRQVDPMAGQFDQAWAIWQPGQAGR